MSRKRSNIQTIETLLEAIKQEEKIPMSRPFRKSSTLDKKLVFVSKTTVSTQENTVLVTATFPCTIVGLRWSLAAIKDAGSTIANCTWVIQIVKEGATIPTLAVTDAADVVNPEENVLVFGFTKLTGAINILNAKRFEGHTKSMRKLQVADRLVFSVLGTATETFQFGGVVQFFCKTS